ncbi:hypothetical protein OWR29_17065 [Actinoplanes sp. Pm04-4]|uniref:Uncharacterized protein n=1 Tax=Paractinoplanes pyxinae TaxID=2997416 RepID=A0ABT4AZP8_9ACTN|nr:hypothetical protein [Actinoplanes pyxinae]MCY1139714.1 hypothetical protein [Actinoplanes pyxinae]
MLELGYVPLVTAANARIMTSAQPGSPVIPESPPGRLRLTAAAALHRLATRLDRGAPVPAATYRTRPAA